jgi:hypothetical protein
MSISAIILVIVFAVVLLVLISLMNKVTPRGIDRPYFKNEWNDILKMMQDPKMGQMSIIQADKLLDEALKCCGYRGTTMGERLVSAKHVLKHRDNVWSAHKLRNKLVHESMAEPSAKDVQRALKGYQQAFNDLRVF